MFNVHNCFLTRDTWMRLSIKLVDVVDHVVACFLNLQINPFFCWVVEYLFTLYIRSLSHIMGSIAARAVVGIAAVDGARMEMDDMPAGFAVPAPPSAVNQPGSLTFCSKYGSGMQTGPICPNNTNMCCYKTTFWTIGWDCCGYSVYWWLSFVVARHCCDSGNLIVDAFINQGFLNGGSHLAESEFSRIVVTLPSPLFKINFEQFLSSASKILHENYCCSPFLCTPSDEMTIYNPTNNWSTYTHNGAGIGMSMMDHRGIWIESHIEMNNGHMRV